MYDKSIIKKIIKVGIATAEMLGQHISFALGGKQMNMLSTCPCAISIAAILIGQGANQTGIAGSMSTQCASIKCCDALVRANLPCNRGH